MIFSAAPPPVESVIAESFSPRAPTEFVAHTKPVTVAGPAFKYRRKVLPIEGGRVLLRVTQAPSIVVDPKTLECEVRGWGIRMPAGAVENLPTAMARRFLDLFSQVDRGRLNDADAENWLHIVDQVDVAAFNIDRAAPHYLEGTLVRLTPVCLVEWHDGERQRIERPIATSLGSLLPGDQFGAFVKLGRDNEVLSIERLTLLALAQK